MSAVRAADADYRGLNSEFLRPSVPMLVEPTLSGPRPSLVSVRRLPKGEGVRVTHIGLAADRLPSSILQIVQETPCQISLAGPIDGLLEGTFALSSVDLFVVAVSGTAAVLQAAAAANQSNTAWIAWNLNDVSEVATAAYEAGAHAVLPAEVSAAAFTRAVATVCAGRDDDDEEFETQLYQPGEQLHLPLDRVLVVRAGVVAETAIHEDGVQTLTGLWGSNSFAIRSGATETKSVLTAHTQVTAALCPWHICATDPQFSSRVRTRLEITHDWVSACGHPHLERRILDLLKVLGQSFGVDHMDGMLVDVGISHAQLAAAVGTTRATLSRQVAAMRRRGQIRTVQVAGGRRRFLVRQTPAE